MYLKTIIFICFDKSGNRISNVWTENLFWKSAIFVIYFKIEGTFWKYNQTI